MYSKRFPSGSSKNTDAAGIQAKTIGSSIGSPRPPRGERPRGVMPAERSALPLSRAQLDPLLFHGASRPLEKRTFSFCSDSDGNRLDF
jgi:hypothetical protein